MNKKKKDSKRRDESKDDNNVSPVFKRAGNMAGTRWRAGEINTDRRNAGSYGDVMPVCRKAGDISGTT